MNKGQFITIPTTHGVPVGDFWPSDAYDEQIQLLQKNTGSDIYIVEVIFNDINIAVNMDSKPIKLLDVIKFKGHDPQRRLYPHMLILEDGRGLNLGWIARISCNKPFDPEPQDILYLESTLLEQLLFHERQLNEKLIAKNSREYLAAVLGKPINPLSLED